MVYQPALDRTRRAVLRWRGTRLAYLGDGSGNLYAPGSNGARAYVRFAASADANSNATYTSPIVVKVKPVFIPPYDGAPVRVGYDEWGELVIKEADTEGMEAAGISPRMGNPADPQNKFVFPEQIVIGQVRPAGTASKPSTKVTWQTVAYDDLNGDMRSRNGPSGPSALYDLAPFIPTAGNWRRVVIWLDTYTGLISATGSTAQSMTSPLDFTDFQECDDTRPADSIPLGSFVLQNAQTSIDSTNIGPDIRQFLARPSRIGNPNPVLKNERVWPNKQAVFYGTLTVTSGSLEVLGEVVVI